MSDFTIGRREVSPPEDLSTPPARPTAEWGTASIVIGCLLVLTAPMILIVNILMAVSGPCALGMSPGEVQLATVGFFVCLGLGLLGGVVGIVCGAISLGFARSSGQSIALGLAGLLISIVGLILLSIVTVDTVFIFEWFNRVPRR